MDKESFEIQFNKIIADPLINIGFQKSGKSLYIVEGNIAVSLIRLGGRFSISDGISHILCFRHSFLPNMNGKIPDGYEKEVFSYPIKLKPSKVKGIFGTTIKYNSNNLRYNQEKFNYKNMSQEQTIKYLKKVFEAVVILLNWGRSSPHIELEKQIKSSGESAWIEKIWLSAYAKNHI